LHSIPTVSSRSFSLIVGHSAPHCTINKTNLNLAIQCMAKAMHSKQ